MDNFIAYLEERHIINEMQRAFGEMILRRCDIADKSSAEGQALFALAALALKAVQESNSCLDITEWCSMQLEKLAAEENALPDAEALFSAWKQSVLNLKTDAIATSDETDKIASAPLILCRKAGTLIYLNRFYKYERQVEETIRSMASRPCEEYDLNELKNEVHKASCHFENRTFEDDDQQQAVFNAVQSPFSIITGGPGRGKTTVLTEILAIKLKHNPSLRIAICAPTGKAAARMKQSIDSALKMDETHPTADLNKALFGNEVFQKLGELRPMTVHTLIGLHKESDYPKMNRHNPLEYDLVAVDECSMMSLQLFHQLLEALKPETKLILLGDENQLASVDEGVVLAELCHADELNSKNDPRLINRLIVNHRSNKNDALCAYTDAIVDDSQQPDINSFFSPASLTKTPLFAAVEIDEQKSREQLREMIELALEKADVRDKWENIRSWQEAYSLLDKCKVLSPVREGKYGVGNLNAIIRNILNIKDEYGNGVPVMITQNDKLTGLCNGDIGVCFNKNIYFKTLREDGTEEDKCFSPAQLPPHETAFAMTIHKSQGSDYANVLIVIPPKENNLLTRELIYTAISRAKINLLMLAKKSILSLAQQKKIQRWSSLMK